MKKRLSSNVNVRVGLQHTPGPAKGYEDGSCRVYTALRDLPGTQPYLYAKKGVALNMYEQLGRPNFFLTLTAGSAALRAPHLVIRCVFCCAGSLS